MVGLRSANKSNEKSRPDLTKSLFYPQILKGRQGRAGLAITTRRSDGKPCLDPLPPPDPQGLVEAFIASETVKRYTLMKYLSVSVRW